jgi:hypothetical protein
MNLLQTSIAASEPKENFAHQHGRNHERANHCESEETGAYDLDTTHDDEHAQDQKKDSHTPNNSPSFLPTHEFLNG